MGVTHLIETLKALTAEEDLLWMQRFGYELTVAARASAYEAGTDLADGTRLRGFNEIQHRVYGRMSSLRRQEEWTIESFIDFVSNASAHFGIDDEFGYALNRSMAQLKEQRIENTASLSIATCTTCGRKLDVSTDPLSVDCGRDCWGCVGMFEFEMGDEMSAPRVRLEIEQGLRNPDGRPKSI